MRVGNGPVFPSQRRRGKHDIRQLHFLESRGKFQMSQKQIQRGNLDQTEVDRERMEGGLAAKYPNR